MKILLVHSDFIEYEPRKKAISNAEEIEKRHFRIDDCLVVFCSSEEGDTDKVVGSTAGEIRNVAKQVETKRIVIYPFVHLTASPSKPQVALHLLKEIEKELSKDYETFRAPFGWYKGFTLKCKGHPLSELSREIRESGVVKEAERPKEQKKQPTSKIILDRRDLLPSDHRILGEQLGIFHLSDDIGPGLPLWLPKGETLRNILVQYMRQVEEQNGYKYVSTPHITRGSMYEKTGHLPYYKDTMYAPVAIEEEEYYLKPMNCPHHHVIYSKLVESYRDLPLRLAEAGTTYRNELSGVTYGLIRVRCFTQNDSHIYVMPDQLKDEFIKVLRLFKDVYDVMGIKDYWFRLSLPDFKTNPDKFTGDPKEWDHACEEIRKAMKEFGANFVEETGEAAFYGPKIDVQIKNAHDKEETIATSQVDIVVPKRLGLSYVDTGGNKKTPIVIHRAILGSYERFVAYLLEQTEGRLPLWLAPVQVAVVSVTDRNITAAEKIAAELRGKGIRVESDTRNHTLQYKIREAELQKVPYILVIGDKEQEKGTVAVRKRDIKEVKFDVKPGDFISQLLKEIEAKNK